LFPRFEISFIRRKRFGKFYLKKKKNKKISQDAIPEEERKDYKPFFLGTTKKCYEKTIIKPMLKCDATLVQV